MMNWQPFMNNVYVESRTKTYGDRAFSVTGPVLWNKLPDELRHELSLNSFKSKLKTFLLKHF